MKKLIITENDKEYIKSLYGILNEQKTPQVSNDSGLFSKMKASNNYYWEQAYSNTNETDEKKIEEAKQLSLKALFNQLSSNKDRYNESGVCYIITKLEGGRYKSVAYIHKDSIDGVNHGCFDENAPKASTEKLIPKSTTTTTTIQSPTTPKLNKIDWNKIPDWLIGTPMNFYEKKEQTDDYPHNTKITNIISYDPTAGRYRFGMSDVSWSKLNSDRYYKFNELDFSCREQNEELGSFTFIDNQKRIGQTFWNKTIAEKYFAPYFCSKNSQGKWVPKVENPDFGQKDINKQQKFV